jgi:hypothetical protein
MKCDYVELWDPISDIPRSEPPDEEPTAEGLHARESVAKQFHVVGRAELGFSRDDRFPVLDIPTEIPLLQVHCPKMSGSKAQLSLTSGSASRQEAKISVAALELGAAIGVTVEESETYRASNGHCTTIAIPARLQVEWGVFDLDGQPRASGARALLRLDEPLVFRERVLLSEEDACIGLETNVGAIALRTIDRSSLPVTAPPQKWSQRLTIEKEAHVSLGFGLAVHGVTASFGVDVAITSSRDVSLSVELPGAATYTAYRLGSALPWTVVWRTSSGSS